MKKIWVWLLCTLLLATLTFDCIAEGFEGHSDISYVLIYNPALWDESIGDGNKTLMTGDFSAQIDTSMAVRAGFDDEEPEFVYYDQPIFTGLPEGVELTPDSFRAGGFAPIYEEGETHAFYVGEPGVDRREETLTCLYAGEYCYIWSLGDSISSEQAKRYGKEFDEVIYPADTETFGFARFTDDGGKINVFFYPFTTRGLLGFFYPVDLFAAAEWGSEAFYKEKMYNVDHAIINVNSKYCTPEYERTNFSTQAHEFQHLICFTGYFESYYNSYGQTMDYADTWLNEAMSGYIEEKIFPGIQKEDGRYRDIATSSLVRHGQSLYNFKTENTFFSFDIGVYGSVFLFSEYLDNAAGGDVFHKIHDYFRSGKNLDLSTPAALYHSMPEEFIRAIDEKYVFPDSVQFASVEQEWVSKMTLDFYLSMLRYDADDPAAFEPIDARTLLYDEMGATAIEGGGRVILAVRGGSFTIPADADSGLIYIGLNSAFEPVTDICVK